jgi:hypothetical protein
MRIAYCKYCGCVTHYDWGKKQRLDKMMAVNGRIFELGLLESIPVKKLDGARHWDYEKGPPTYPFTDISQSKGREMSMDFVSMLSGGHPNSLGHTEEVVKIVLNTPDRIDELYAAYDSEDEVVRLRVSSSFKRIFLAHPEWFKKWYVKFSKRVLKLQQPSALWTYALLCLRLEDQLTPKNKLDAIDKLKEILTTCDDWIVTNNTIETLGHWAIEDPGLRKWLKPKLKKYAQDRRKSVAKKTEKVQSSLGFS